MVANWVYWRQVKVGQIIWLSNLSILSVPDELFQKRVVRTKFDIYVLASVYKEFSLVSVDIYNMQHFNIISLLEKLNEIW
jgi:hypothetical protein